MNVIQITGRVTLSRIRRVCLEPSAGSANAISRTQSASVTGINAKWADALTFLADGLTLNSLHRHDIYIRFRGLIFGSLSIPRPEALPWNCLAGTFFPLRFSLV